MKIKESEKYLSRELKNAVEHDGEGDTNYSWCTRKGLEKKTERKENQRNHQNHPDHSIVKIGLNTQKGPVNLRRLTVSQTPINNHL